MPTESRNEMELTEAEIYILTLLADATQSFFELPDHHPLDKQEWAHEMHHLQQRVMCRVAVRVHPKFFTPHVENELPQVGKSGVRGG
jgi:hypothetical protein